jgi:uncharacterized spore protein YtfJ
MKLDEILGSARDAITVRRVFAEPYEREGLTIITGAAVSGGGGGGSGGDQRGQEGAGGGFGVNARPAGAFVVRDGKVRWYPAVDVNRLAGALAIVAVAYLFARARIMRSPRR